MRGEGSRTWDKIWSLPAIGVPIIVHSPETNWGFGLGVQSYFQIKPILSANAQAPQAPTSMIYFDGCYTLNKQYYVSAGGTLYFGGWLPWFMQIRGSYRNYPDSYYGIGNDIHSPYIENRSPLTYTSKRGTAHIEAQIYLPLHWSIGPLFDFQYEEINNPTGVAGLTAQRSIMWALGAVTQYDTRDTLYYPSKGLLFKTSIAYYEPKLGCTARVFHWQADLRQFISLPKDIIFAWQFKTEWALSDNVASIPFQCLPTFGGQDLVRGVRRNMFRDNVMMALQAEFRFPIWRWFRLHAFAGIGDVYNTDQWRWATPKVGYGLGLRVCINKAKVNLRFDIARNNIYKEWNTWESYAFYLTATEAF